MKGRTFSSTLLISILLFLLLAAGCTSNKGIDLSQSIPTKVGLLLEGNIYDQGWDSLAYQALRRIEREMHTQVDYFEFKNKATSARIKSKAIEMIDRGINVIFGHGAVFQNAFNQLGPIYPNVTFLFFNGEAKGSNVYSINFSPVSLGFFAGMGAALMSKSGVVGLVTAYPKQLEVKGFQAGVEYINKDIDILNGTVGNWGDRKRGKEVSELLISKGADVLFGLGDGFNIEVINTAREHGVYAIGFIRDQSFIARDTVLFSVTQNVENIYMQLVQSIKNKQINKEHVQIVDFNTGGQSITSFGEMVPITVRDQIMQAVDLYVKGKLKIS